LLISLYLNWWFTIKLLIALYLRKLPNHNEHLHFTFMRSTYLYAVIQCVIVEPNEIWGCKNPIVSLRNTTQLCRRKSLIAAGGTLRSCALVHKEQRKCGSQPTARLLAMAAGTSVTLRPGHVKRLTKRQRKHMTWF